MEAVSKNDRHSKVNHRNRIIREFWYAFKKRREQDSFFALHGVYLCEMQLAFKRSGH